MSAIAEEGALSFYMVVEAPLEDLASRDYLFFLYCLFLDLD